MFGGAFDPFHNGHLMMLMSICEQLNIDYIHMIPNYNSPDKEKATLSDVQRLKCVKAIADGFSTRFSNKIKFSCIDYELKQKKTSYTIDTLNFLGKQYPKSNWILLIGSDNFFKFHTWKQYKDILNQVTLFVVKRDSISIKSYTEYMDIYFLNELNAGVILLNNEPITISSTKIREKMSKNISIETLVPDIIRQELESIK
ncbi:nicotinate (nicotinamide) nucleotide adenylyltransferase [bacterium]|nr:nicotinate (nicotinamide) nucleotide adenylyltransferase [bacterium]